MKDATPKDPGSTVDSPPTDTEPLDPTPTDIRYTALSTALLDWTGALTASALTVVPLWMLFSNSAVLRGHPALPALLMATAAAGLLWAFSFVRRTAPREGWNRSKQQGLTRPKPRRRTVSRWQLFRGLAVRLSALVLVAGLAWLNPFPHQPSGADGQTSGTATEDATSITLAPEGKAAAGLVFYPGARVDSHAYRDILGPLANAGYLVVILKVPLGIALLDTNQAREVMDRHPEITTWAVGGHSLGGVSASSFAKSSQDASGLLLFASFPAESMTDSGHLSVLSISGSNDGLTTPDKIAASKPLLPPASSFATVEGGVHAFFGDYGDQPGDGAPGISRQQAQQQITAESVRFMDGLASTG